MPRRGGGEEASVSAASLALGAGGGVPWARGGGGGGGGRQRPGEAWGRKGLIWGEGGRFEFTSSLRCEIVRPAAPVSFLTRII